MYYVFLLRWGPLCKKKVDNKSNNNWTGTEERRGTQNCKCLKAISCTRMYVLRFTKKWLTGAEECDQPAAVQRGKTAFERNIVWSASLSLVSKFSFRDIPLYSILDTLLRRSVENVLFWEWIKLHHNQDNTICYTLWLNWYGGEKRE